MTRLLMLPILLFGSGFVGFAQETPEQTLENELSKAKLHYRRAKSLQLDVVNEVQIHLVSYDNNLTEEEGKALNETDIRHYIQLPNGNFAKVLSRKELDHSEANALIELLKKGLKEEKPSPGAMCHFPTHFLSFFRKDKQNPSKGKCLLSISVSVHCHNFVFPFGNELGNQAISTAGGLQAELLKLVAYPISEQSRFEGDASNGFSKD